jgi:hypothetical protein
MMGKIGMAFIGSCLFPLAHAAFRDKDTIFYGAPGPPELIRLFNEARFSRVDYVLQGVLGGACGFFAWSVIDRFYKDRPTKSCASKVLLVIGSLMLWLHLWIFKCGRFIQ